MNIAVEKNSELRASISAAVEAVVPARKIENITIAEKPDSENEPSIFIDVFVDTKIEGLKSGTLLETVDAVVEALKNLNDPRFPYIRLRYDKVAVA